MSVFFSKKKLEKKIFIEKKTQHTKHRTKKKKTQKKTEQIALGGAARSWTWTGAISVCSANGHKKIIQKKVTRKKINIKKRNNKNNKQKRSVRARNLFEIE